MLVHFWSHESDETKKIQLKARDDDVEIGKMMDQCGNRLSLDGGFPSDSDVLGDRMRLRRDEAATQFHATF